MIDPTFGVKGNGMGRKGLPKKPLSAPQQLDFWPPLKTRSMVACARVSYVRSGLTGVSLAAAVHVADASPAPLGAHPDGNHGDNHSGSKAPTSDNRETSK